MTEFNGRADDVRPGPGRPPGRTILVHGPWPEMRATIVDYVATGAGYRAETREVPASEIWQKPGPG
jgi:hypothetical protein